MMVDKIEKRVEFISQTISCEICPYKCNKRVSGSQECKDQWKYILENKESVQDKVVETGVGLMKSRGT